MISNKMVKFRTEDIATAVSGNHTASIFMIDEKVNQETGSKQSCFFSWLTLH
jgi:hypothetical protein